MVVHGASTRGRFAFGAPNGISYVIWGRSRVGNPAHRPRHLLERDMTTSVEKAKLDREMEALMAMSKALNTVDEADRPRILGAVAALYGIDALPTAPRPR